MELIPSPEDVGAVTKLDGDLFDLVLALIGNRIRDDIKSATDTLSIYVTELEHLTKTELSNDMMELVADTVSRSGWEVMRHDTWRKLDLLHIVAPAKTVLIRRPLPD